MYRARFSIAAVCVVITCSMSASAAPAANHALVTGSCSENDCKTESHSVGLSMLATKPSISSHNSSTHNAHEEKLPEEEAAEQGIELPGAHDPNGPSVFGEEKFEPSRFNVFLALLVLVASGIPPLVVLWIFLFPSKEASVDVTVKRAAAIVARSGLVLLRVGLAIVYFWFGILKVFGISPAEPLVQLVFRTLPIIGIQELASEVFFTKVVGAAEAVLATCFLLTMSSSESVRYWSTIASVALGIGHMVAATVLPMALLPVEVWEPGRFPYGLTFEGQYVFKNLVLSAGILCLARDLE